MRHQFDEPTIVTTEKKAGMKFPSCLSWFAFGGRRQEGLGIQGVVEAFGVLDGMATSTKGLDSSTLHI